MHGVMKSSECFVNKIICGNAADVLQKIPSGSIQCCITSPPYYGLRDYGESEQIGLENSLDDYFFKLIFVFNEIKRILKNEGVLWVNIADTRKRKKLLHVPEKFMLHMEKSGWILRDDIIWHKTNAMPESTKDRLTNCYEHIYMFTKKTKYYFNLAAAMEPAVGFNREPVNGSVGAFGPNQSRRRGNRKTFRGNTYTNKTAYDNDSYMSADSVGNTENKSGLRRMRNVWSIATTNKSTTKIKHYAKFPDELAKRCILLSSQENDIVLDPFVGSGTTCRIANQYGRKYIGIDINNEYCRAAADDIPIKLF